MSVRLNPIPQDTRGRSLKKKCGGSGHVNLLKPRNGLFFHFMSGCLNLGKTGYFHCEKECRGYNSSVEVLSIQTETVMMSCGFSAINS